MGTGGQTSREPKDLRFRQYDLFNPLHWAALASLLRDVFEIDVTVLDRLGGPDPTSMAFGWFDSADRLVANLSAFALPMVINGKSVMGAGLQSGAVRPEFRRRGLFRDVTEKALSWCETQGFEAIFLYTDQPGLYTPHGFRILPQSCFSTTMPDIPPAATTLRRLDLANETDLALVKAMLATRAPVSGRFSAMDQNRMFLLNAWLSNDILLGFSAAQDAIIAWRHSPETLQILDIVGRKTPNLSLVLSEIDMYSHRIEIDFPPDRLSMLFSTSADDNEMVMMMCGPDNLRPDGPIRLPELARF